MLSAWPGTKSGPGASSNMMDFRFCEVQNWLWKCCSLVRNVMWSPKKGLHGKEILTVFPVKIRWSPKKKCLQASHADFSVSFRWARWSQRPSWSPWVPSRALGSLYPPSAALDVISKFLTSCVNKYLLESFPSSLFESTFNRLEMQVTSISDGRLH